MRKTLLLLICFVCAFAQQIQAETFTDVSGLYLENAGFDTEFNYGANTTGNVSGDVLNRVFGWDKDMDATFTVAGTFAYGSGATFNGSSAIPNVGYLDSEGGALALSTGWGVTLKYSQSVSLPAGEYQLISAYYNVGTASVGTSQLGWVPSGSTAESTLSSVNAFPVKTWLTDTLKFTVPEGGLQGKIQVGYTAGGSGSGSSAKILIDYVRILSNGINKTALNKRIAEAEAVYAKNSTGIGAADFLNLIDQAKAVATNPESSMEEVVNIAAVLKDSTLKYQLDNTTSENPYDMTDRIINPSFESGFDGWKNSGLASQGNTNFPFKNGNTYIEKWVNRGSKVPNVSVQQKFTGIYNGQYTLYVAAGNIQQSAAGSTVNISENPQTGVVVYAGNNVVAVDTIKEYVINFVVFDNEITIGLTAENATGNWVMCDNFRLFYNGFDINTIAETVEAKITTAETLLTQKMQNPVKQSLETATEQAQQAVAAEPLVLEQLHATDDLLREMIETAKISVGAYVTLQTAIEKAIGEYGTGDKEGATEFDAAIKTAQILNDNLDASLTELNDMVVSLEKAALAYLLANATGTTPRVVTNPNYARGATAAFGRSTVSGVTAANLLEQGFCWAEHPEPTVLDNRTTKYFSKNGNIYHLQNLKPATIYYMRAYAMTKTYAVGYGDVIKVITIPKGSVTFQLNSSVTGAAGHHERIKAAMESAVDYFNNLTSIQGHHLSVNHHPGTPTAEAGYNGTMQFGANSAYQKTGTAMHEMGHTVGVGTHSIWYGSSSPLREGAGTGKWLGERANKVVQFLDNVTESNGGYMRGDKVHMWPYGINGASEDTGSELLYIGNSLIVQGLGEDGLPPTGGFTTPSYTFEQEDNVKYYIKNEAETCGRNTSFLMENADGNLVYKAMSTNEALLNDSTAWHFSFTPSTAYYQIKNVATGKYFTYKTASGVNGISLASKAILTGTENFQLMRARVDTKIDSRNTTFTTRGYWIIRPEKQLNPPCFSANTNGTTSSTTFNLGNSAITQRWLLLTEDEVCLLEEALQPSDVPQISSSGVFIFGQKGNIRIENIVAPSDIAIYDIFGKLQSIANNVSETYSQALPKGVYLVSIRSMHHKDAKKVIVW